MTINKITNKNRARAAGIFYIVATAAGILNVVLTLQITGQENLLQAVGANQSTVTLSALIELIMAVAIIYIPVMLFSKLKEHNDTIAISYLVSRILEIIPIIGGSVITFLLVTISQANSAGLDNSAVLPAAGKILLMAHGWTDLVGTQIVFSLTALILNISLYKTRIVPRFISIWGLIGAVLILLAGFLSMFGITASFNNISMALYAPIALQEMVFAVWLIVKGTE